MIRRKVSNGLLRAATQVQSASAVSSSSATAHAVSSSPMQQQTANLASAVLLSSQRNWKGETVVTLKNELKKRGLSQSGNKSTLIARLASADTSQLLPPMPKRSLSTSPVSSAAKKGPSTPSKQDDTATSANEKEMTTGPEISSKRAEAEPLEKPTAEQVTVAPGLPESGKVEPSSGEQLSMKMPNTASEGPSKDQVIAQPLEPDNFRSNDQIPEPTDKSGDVPGPKVMTVASASTHLSGGPVSAVHESGDSAQIDENDKNLGDLTPNFQGAGKALASAVNSLTGMSKTAGEFSRVLVPQVGLPKAQGGKGEDYKPPKEGLNDEERRGLWILGGIVGLGLVLGGTGRDKKGSALGSKVGSAVNAVKGSASSGPKGDAQWEKASGAGVVGHGSRKE